MFLIRWKDAFVALLNKKKKRILKNVVLAPRINGRQYNSRNTGRKFSNEHFRPDERCEDI